MKNITPELIAKAKAAKTAEELLEIAKANNVELTEEQAQTYFAQLSAKGTVADDELDAVAGGGCITFSAKDNFFSAPTLRYEIAPCRNCRCTVGILEEYESYIKCENCKMFICNLSDTHLYKAKLPTA